MKTTYNKITLNFVLILLLILFASNKLLAQISGPTTVDQGDTENYTQPYSGATNINWDPDSGNLVSYNAQSATVQWNNYGTQTLYFNGYYNGNWYLFDLQVQVNSLGPSTPSNPTVQSSSPGSVILQRTGSPPSGVTWYWQSTYNGISTSNGSGSTKTVTSGSNYYIRARNSSGTWSASSGSISYSVPPIPHWFYDGDGDNWGDPSVSVQQVSQPANYVSNGTDLCPSVYGTDNGCPESNFSNENYIYTIRPRVATTNINYLIEIDKKIEAVQYFDGLGRSMQSVGIRAGGNNEDVITYIEYDDYGRQAKEYLPFATTSQGGHIYSNPVNAVNSFYNTTKYENTTNPYSEKDFEASPLSRVLKQAAPGNDWQLGSGHEIEFDYESNIVNEVRLFNVTLNSTYTPSLVLNGYYGVDELYKTITKDENHTGNTKNHTTEEFKDKEGRVVLKRTYNTDVAHDTYYVYDKFGNLTYVLPPKVTTSNVSTTELNELCYQYKYDSRNRLIEKKIPGKGWEEIVYNKLDQPVLTRDPNMKAQGKALFTKYDAFGRVTYTGRMNVSASTTRSSLQTTAASFSIQYETKNGTATTYAGTPVYYSKSAYPTSFDEVHTINYYDNYTFDLAGLSIPTGNIIYNQLIATNTNGLATGSKVKVLGTTNWITTITIYDRKGRPIYIASKNEYLNTTDIVQTEYDFTGNILKTRTRHQKGSDQEIVTLDAFEYDHVGRLINQIQCVGDDSLPDDCSGGNAPAGENPVYSSPITTTQNYVASNSIILDSGFMVEATSSLSFTASIETGGEQITANHYDELGQLESKNIGGISGGSGLQTVNYKYNIRGWLKEINDPNNLGTDLFAFGIKYNTPDYSPSTRGLFNGNISETHWITANDNKNRNYRYQYDALNRIVDAINIGENEGHRYRVINITYDKNGNLLGLHRNGWKNEAVSYGNIDVLEYTYDSGNQLTKVKDYGSGDYGFKDGTNTGNDYAYDANGNLTSDANKQITSILYNHLNLPTEVKFNNLNTRKINYIYGADGTKLQKLVNDNGNETATEYAGNYIYENNVLQFFNTAEGYVTSDNNGGYDYVYQYKDHLGNIRLSYSDLDNNGSVDASEILDEKNYYPFGLVHEGYNTNVQGTYHPYGFGGMEENNDLNLNTMDFGARNYDPALGRWMNLDPLAELMRRHSPYNYGFDNPIRFTDPDGMSPNDVIIEGSAEFKKEALADLQKITDNTLEIDDNGKVTEVGCTGDSCKEGTSLVSELINADEVTTIVESPDGKNHTLPSSHEDAVTKGEGDSTIQYNPDSTEGGVDVTGSKDRTSDIGLAHELGHSREMVNGTEDLTESDYVNPYEDNPNDGHYRAPNTYAPLDKNEVKVRKLESRIRKEQNKPARKMTRKKDFKWKGKF